MNTEKYEIAVVGAGIVGLGTALALAERYPHLSLVILEKESRVAGHQTSHNSGVIHAGIYYRPGSYKAKLCVEGVRLLKDFCQENGVRYDLCGKVIVAAGGDERQRLQALYERGKANGIAGLEMIGPERLREIEPHARAVQALYSPGTAIVDFSAVAAAMAKKLTDRGVRIQTGSRVRAIHRRDGLLHLEAGISPVTARNLISCGGLYSDCIARMMGLNPGITIIPFRGEYFTLRPECKLVRGLIYPVPDPQFPFLGVHFTKKISGGFEAGPNAVLAFAREGYGKWNIHWGELGRMLAYRGFWAMGRRYWRMGFYEYYRSFSRSAFLVALQKLVPELQGQDMAPGGSGVRAQAVTSSGSLVDDFQIVEAPNAIHVLNAPSPAATASLAIGRHIANLAGSAFGL